MDPLSAWFTDHLQTTAEGFIWSFEQVPPERRAAQPPAKLGEWTPVRHVFHLLTYEQTIALPSMRQWLGDGLPAVNDDDEEAAWKLYLHQNAAVLIGLFKTVRTDQISLLSRFDNDTWNSIRETVWGPQTLRWVVSKTYQHTTEHISDILRIALFS